MMTNHKTFVTAKMTIAEFLNSNSLEWSSSDCEKAPCSVNKQIFRNLSQNTYSSLFSSAKSYVATLSNANLACRIFRCAKIEKRKDLVKNKMFHFVPSFDQITFRSSVYCLSSQSLYKVYNAFIMVLNIQQGLKNHQELHQN